MKHLLRIILCLALTGGGVLLATEKPLTTVLLGLSLVLTGVGLWTWWDVLPLRGMDAGGEDAPGTAEGGR